MKKLIASLAVAFLMTAGLVAGTSATATAGPYTGTVPSQTYGNAFNTKSKKNVRVRVNIRAAQGNGTPKGQVQVTIVRTGNGKVVGTFTRYYNGNPGTYKFRTTGLRPGSYRVIVTFLGGPRSTYQGSSSVDGFRVRR